jgi:hypothetical protein
MASGEKSARGNAAMRTALSKTNAGAFFTTPCRAETLLPPGDWTKL